MLILGLDPGSTRVGYGFIQKGEDRPRFISSGILDIKSKQRGERLLDLEKSFTKLLKKYKPDIVALEKLYFVKNLKTGLEVAQSIGVLTLIIIKHKIPLLEYTPLEVKSSLTGYGQSQKSAVQKMVQKILGIKKIVGGDDAADGLALAITALSHPFDLKKLKTSE